MTITVNKKEFQDRFDELLLLAERGTEVYLHDPGLLHLRIAHAPEPQAKRIPGLHAGRGWMSDDFDAPLPPEYLPGEE